MNALETLVLDLIGEDTTAPDVFDDAGIVQVRDSINAAIQELSMVRGGYRRTYSMPLHTGRMIYRMVWKRDHFGYCLEVWDRARHRRLEQTTLRHLAQEDRQFLSRTGRPTRYAQIGLNHLLLHPAADDDGAMVEIICAAIPQFYSDSPVHLRQQFQRAAALYACSEFYASRGDAQRAGDFFREYLDVGNLQHLTPRLAPAVPK